MKKSLIALALVGAFAAPAAVQVAAAAEEASPHTITGNMTLATSYRFRGIDQTFGKPTLQGGIDYSHASGLYAGNWNSNVSSGAGFPDGNLEMDFYGGYRTTFGDFGLDLGAILYYYPGSEGGVLDARADNDSVTNKEIYLGASWKFISVKYSYSIDDYFSLRGTANNAGKSTKGTSYLETNLNYDLGDGWGVNGHIGHLSAKNIRKGSYTDWKVGVTKDVGGWLFGLSYIDTNAAGSCSKGEFYCFTNSNAAEAGALDVGDKSKDAGRGIAVLSVSKSF